MYNHLLHWPYISLFEVHGWKKYPVYVWVNQDPLYGK